MRSISILGIAAVSALAVAPVAFAQDTAYASSNSPDSASGKHWAVVGSATILQPKDDAAPGVHKLDGDVSPTISASYFFNDNIAVELWGAADKFNHRVRGPQGKVGSVDELPIALSAQYHFGQADNVFRPFVGVGYYESDFSNEKIDDLSPSGQHVALDKGRGAIGTVGVDMNINATWFARADARYMRSRPDVSVGGVGTGEQMKLDPWTVGVGVGARF